MILISHRGYSAYYPENTMLAFEKSIEAGMGWIELDIALTSDKKIVVLHDDDIQRTSNGSGLVSKFTYKELLNFDFGSWKNPHCAGEKIPLLDDVLNAFEDRLEMNIEIKSGFYEESEDSDSIENQLLAKIKKQGLLSKILISSFDKRYLIRLAQKEPRLRIALLVSDESIMEVRETLKECRFYSLHISKEDVSKEWVDFAHNEMGLKVYVYTVNTPEYYNKALTLGVDGIFTDYSEKELFTSNTH